jgi:hypothetical protein
MLRCSQLANVQALDEDDVKDEQTVRKHEVADLLRDGSADSPHDSVGDIDFLMDNIEALLSCPHAIPISLGNTNTWDANQRVGFGNAYRNRSSCDCCA